MRISKFFKSTICLVATIILVASCKPGIPDDYIQPGEMEDILYDYHIAMAMADQGNPAERDERVIAYKDAVLKKHGVSNQKMEASMQYYMRHTEQLHDIYDNLSERLNDEAKDLGASGASVSKEYSQNGDTTNVWRGAQATLLSPVAGLNTYAFSIKVDTTFHKGDRLSLEFNSNYIIQDGSRNAVAVLTVKLQNDSIVSQVTRISSDSRMQATFMDFGNIGIKEVSGYFLFPPDNGLVPPTTMKILCLTNIRLLRMHKTAAPANEPIGPGAPANMQPNPGMQQPVNAPVTAQPPAEVQQRLQEQSQQGHMSQPMRSIQGRPQPPRPASGAPLPVR